MGSGLEKLTMLGRLSAALQRFLLRRELVGIDEFNNQYFKWVRFAGLRVILADECYG